ncbi:hypothetical protein SASPL_141753 [Salvia splendens]|uniref:Sodium/calcium exchanger membrane region domain-containing protein n=1 Tax=Salvia splendens TaxID=180675 RepID=A0A8X8WJA1_SALSN|nr:hypothetical protein SASPL_141753 [Salvia splendens]
MHIQVRDNDEADEDEVPEISPREAIGWLAMLTMWISLLSGYLVDEIQVTVSDSMNMPLSFFSVILLPIVGNAAEHASAIMSAMKDKLVSVGISQHSVFVTFLVHNYWSCDWIIYSDINVCRKHL